MRCVKRPEPRSSPAFRSMIILAGYVDHCRTKQAPIEQVTFSHFVQNRVFFHLIGRCCGYSLMEVWVELLTLRFDSFQTEAAHSIHQLLIDKFETLQDCLVARRIADG